jgi:hypothetical protein
MAGLESIMTQTIELVIWRNKNLKVRAMRPQFIDVKTCVVLFSVVASSLTGHNMPIGILKKRNACEGEHFIFSKSPPSF